jgi:hypothetical protein
MNDTRDIGAPPPERETIRSDGAQRSDAAVAKRRLGMLDDDDLVSSDQEA